MREQAIRLVLVLLVVVSPPLAEACVLCTFCPGSSNTLAREAGEAKFVVFGTLTNARLNADGVSGTTDVIVETWIKGDSAQVKGKTITIPRYYQPVPGVSYLIFLDLANGQFDPYRSITSSDRVVQYLRKMPAISPQNLAAERQARLKYTFDYLQDAEPELAADAYKEWALGSNQDVAAVARQLDAGKLRRWLVDPKTQAYCIGLYAYLLGSCGDASDAERLKQLVLTPPDARFKGALDGLLTGYHSARPAESWELARTVAASTDRDFTARYAILRMLKFLHDVEGEKARKDLLSCCDRLLQHADTFDLVVEQLRQWGWWDRSETIFAAFGTPATQAPMTRRAIIRYALKCPESAAKSFLEKRRKEDPTLVKDVEEVMQLLEKP